MSSYDASKISEPVVFTFRSTVFNTVSNATLKKSDDSLVQQVDVFDFMGDDEVTYWVAYFDPGLFLPDTTYKILWSGIDLNGAGYTFTENGILVFYSDAVYSNLIRILRQSIFDEGSASDYPPQSFVNAIRLAASKVNRTPPFSSYSIEEMPLDILIDLARIELYTARLARESLDTFDYNDIGKSFRLDRSDKLRSLIDSLKTTTMEQLTIFKQNSGIFFKGLTSKYLQRRYTGVRGKNISQIIYRITV